MMAKQLRTYQSDEIMKCHVKSAEGGVRLQEIKVVNDLWSDDPYIYDTKRQDEYRKVEPDIYERPNEFLKEPHKTRWTEMSQFWFQENKHLHPRNRRQEWTMTSTYEGPIQHHTQ